VTGGLDQLRLRRSLLPRIALPRIALPRIGMRRLVLPRVRLPGAAQLATITAWATAGVALFPCYLRLSRTAGVDSDGAANVLQAWAMLHGNPMLRGWHVSDVPFYSTELPQYMLIELFRGLRPDVVHVAAAMSYTLLVLLAAMLAKGRATGAEGVIRMLIAAGIMVAPQLGAGIRVLLLDPDHVGSAVPVLATFVVADRAGRRWWLPLLTMLLLTWALIGDSIVALTGVLPLVAASLVRGYQIVVRERRPLPAAAFELGVAASAAAAAGLAHLVLRLITASGGFTVWPVPTFLAPFAQAPHHLLVTIGGLFMLFGADFFGQPLGVAAVLAALHLVGLALAAGATWTAIRRLARMDLVVAALAIAVAAGLAGYLVSIKPFDLHTSREFAAVLPFGAVLAGRLLAAPVRRARLVPALALVLAGYLAGVGRVMPSPAVPAHNQRVAGFLAAHGLSYGLAGYWDANSTTVASGGKVAVRAVQLTSAGFAPKAWESDERWYDPGSHDASFLLLTTRYNWIWAAQHYFGQPARIYYFGSDTIMVWNTNLLQLVRPASPPVRCAACAPGAGG
jgi:hypothetical protein